MDEEKKIKPEAAFEKVLGALYAILGLIGLAGLVALAWVAVLINLARL